MATGASRTATVPAARSGSRWTSGHYLLLGAVVLLAGLLHAVLLPTEGHRFDLDTFALWAHEVATEPLGQAYSGDINLPPVMVYVWAILGLLHPAFAAATDASDWTIRVFLKAPASLADLGLAVAAAWSLRDRPRWAIAAAAVTGLHPALVDDSAWWGQYEALYILPAFIAFLLARAGRPIPAAVALAISVMTKPQALPLILPFVAFALRRLDVKMLAVCGATFVATVVLLWAPFLGDGGPANYLRILGAAQNGAFASVSVGAWNLWWLVGQVLPSPSDSVPILGPLNARTIGLGLAGAAMLVVCVAVWRVPSPRRLALGLACATLVSFSLLTTMHERYSLAAIVFLVPLLPDRRVLGLWIVLSVAVTANVVLSLLLYPPNPDTIGLLLRIAVLGSATILGATLASLWLLVRDGPARALALPPMTQRPMGGQD